jgi:RNA polymerase sigma factor (sigma-70 family)
VARVRGGDRRAYGELVDRHASVAHRAAVLLGAGADADDVVQEAFVKAYRALGRFRPGAPFRPWLLQIVANEARNTHRSSARRSAREQATMALPDSLLPGAAEARDPASLAISAERRTELLLAVRMLEEGQRLVVTCRYLLDLDEAETATVLGLPRGTVKSRLHRALRQLRSQVGREEDGDGC